MSHPISSPRAETFAGSARVLQRALPRVNIDQLLQEDPNLAFLDVRFGLSELTELWGEEEMATIDIDELALALRSISSRPKRTHQFRLEFDAKPLAAEAEAAAAAAAATATSAATGAGGAGAGAGQRAAGAGAENAGESAGGSGGGGVSAGGATEPQERR